MHPTILEDTQILPETTMTDDFTRLALGEVGALGGLYDARTDRILSNSFLKSTAPLEKVVNSQKMPTLKYNYSTTDSLEEKLSNLDVSANLGLSLLCGMVECNLAGGYILKKKHKDHVREASAICSIQTVAERLVFENLDKTYLNLDALKTAGATHVIWGIDWGARTVVKVMEKTISGENTWDLKGNAFASRGAAKKKSEDAKKAEDMKKDDVKKDDVTKDDVKDTESKGKTSDFMGTVVNKIGHVSVGGRLDMDNKLTEKTSKFDFEIITDVSDHSVRDLPKDFEGVLDYMQAMPGRLRGVNGDKGVPQTFYLRSIHDIASAFNQAISQTNLMNRIDESNLIDVARRLDQLESITQQFRNHEKFLRDHSFCVPKAQLKEASKRTAEATGAETIFKDSLRETVSKIRKGEVGNGSLAKLLGGENSSGDESDKSSDFLQKYVRKARFGAEAKERGAMYASSGGDEKTYAIHGPHERVFILHISEDAQAHEDWPLTRQKVWDLLDFRGTDDCVMIEDYDVVKTRRSKLDRPIIEKYMGGALQIEDVVKDEKDLAANCLVRCSDPNIIKPPRSAHSIDRRPVKIQCPGTNCLDDRPYWWNCPNCRKQVFFEPIDSSLCCQCSRYPYSCAVFKCKSTGHGRSWTEMNNDLLLKTLSGLNASQEYNLLLLGETGIGKSTFINALVNYLEFESLDAALNDQGPLRYKIPTHFDYGELADESQEENYVMVNGKKKRRKNTSHIITVGDETEAEQFSRAGQSATSRSRIYNFSIGAAILRIIDTPGMCDTKDIGQDQRNIHDILETLESVDKLSGIMILLPIVQHRVTPNFKHYMTELLSSIHVDASENVLFGYPSANSTHWRWNDVQIALTSTLKELNISIVPHDDNQFMFEAEPFRYLAACKQLGYQLPGKRRYDAMWKRSSDQIYELIEKLDRVPVHEVGKTLCLKRTRDLLRGMPKPLTKIASTMEESQRNLEGIRRDLSQLKTNDTNFSEKLNELQIPIFTLARKDLPTPRIVCSHHPCDRKKACHDRCDVNSPDDIKGHEAVKGCYAFRKGLLFHYGNCRSCGHDWTEHVRMSYEMVREKKPIDNQKKDFYFRELETNKEREDAVTSRMENAVKAMEEIHQEGDQLQIARARFEHYLFRNAMLPEGSRYNDATASYLNDCIHEARKRGNNETVQELERQKKTYEDNLNMLQDAIISETVINKTIEELKKMKHYGESFDSAVNHETFALNTEQRIVYVEAGRGNGLLKRLVNVVSGMSM